MCIRDSHRRRSTSEERSSGPEEAVAGIAETREDVAIGVESVSYTHLRAHETVLDLVCRLLLENKNNKKKKKTKHSLTEQTQINGT